MAIVKAPLLSLGASGALGKTLVGTTWKGIKVLREYVVPANPQTAGQVTQRGYMTTAVSFWRTVLTSAVHRAAWDRAALHDPRTLSGFNAFASGAVKMQPSDEDASFAITVTASGTSVLFTMKNVDDGATGDESGDFAVWQGSKASDLSFSENKTIAAGSFTTSSLGDIGDVVYVQTIKDGQPRSGIAVITLES